MRPVQWQLRGPGEAHHLRAPAGQEDQGAGAQPKQLHQSPGGAGERHHSQTNAQVGNKKKYKIQLKYSSK